MFTQNSLLFFFTGQNVASLVKVPFRPHEENLAPSRGNFCALIRKILRPRWGEKMPSYDRLDLVVFKWKVGKSKTGQNFPYSFLALPKIPF
jgi:hypothetical protein